MEDILKAKIEIFDYCINEMMDDLSLLNHIELFSDAYYEVEATVWRFRKKREELIDQLETLQKLNSDLT